MKVTLTQSSLAVALETAKRVVRKPPIPILANVLLDASSSSLAIRATDLDRQISLSVKADVSIEGATSVPAHLLHDIVRKLPAGADVTLSVDGDGAQMTVSSGRSRFRLQCLPGSDFPQIRRDEEKQSFVLTGDQVRSLFGRVAFATSTEETRFYLCGTYLHRGDERFPSDQLTAVATDGHRLAKAEIPAPEGTEGMPGSSASGTTTFPSSSRRNRSSSRSATSRCSRGWSTARTPTISGSFQSTTLTRSASIAPPSRARWIGWQPSRPIADVASSSSWEAS